MYLHVVDTSQGIAPIPDVLKVIDAKYDSLQEYYAGFAIENVVVNYLSYNILKMILLLLEFFFFSNTVHKTNSYFSLRTSGYKKNHSIQHWLL